MQLDGLTLFGLLSLSAMLVFYALEASQSLVRACNGGGVHRRVSLWLPSGRLALWRSRVDLGGHRVQAVAITAANVVAGLRLGSSSSTLEPRAAAKYTRHQSHVGGGQD